MGQNIPNDPPDRIAAAAWFLIASERTNTAIRQDTIGELEALNLSAQDRDRTEHLSAKLQPGIRAASK
jgi:hypothetical protein